MLELNTRPCMIGVINARSEKHGAEDVPAFDIPLSSIMLSADELVTLTSVALIHRALFDTSGGKLPDPLLPMFKPLQLRDTFKDVGVSIVVGINQVEFNLGNTKIKSITLKPQFGGQTAMACTVQFAPKDLDAFTALFGFMNHDATVQLAGGSVDKDAPKQQQLPMPIDGGSITDSIDAPQAMSDAEIGEAQALALSQGGQDDSDFNAAHIAAEETELDQKRSRKKSRDSVVSTTP